MSDSNAKTGFTKAARRLEKIPPYLFARIDAMREAAKATGMKITNLGIGDPDQPTPKELIDELYEQAKITANQKYPKYAGSPDYRKAVAGYYQKRFGVALDPKTEILALIGSKEGIANMALAVLDPEDIVIIPDPSYPVYAMNAVFAGCECYTTPLLEKNDFLIDFGSIPDAVCQRAKLLWMNYPNNPTSAVASKEFFVDAVAWAKKWGVILAHDNPYSEIYQGTEPPVSLLSVESARDVAIEFNTLSKTFNMTGFRIGMVCGNKEVIYALSTLKSNIDSGVFTAIQNVAIKALNMPLESIEPLRNIYRSRRKAATEALEKAGYEVYPGTGTFYLWAKTPKGMKSFVFVEELIKRTGIVVGPGAGWGEHGEGYFRICLTIDEDGLRNAIKTITETYPAK
ncbi:MAG: LL-diaminopimelate aminotransferase [bacterium]